MALPFLIRAPWGRRLAFALAIAAGLAAAPSPAQAQNSIGSATIVRNDVKRVRAGTASNLETGGAVFLEEAVRTGQNSAARIVFLDQTNLAIGPQAEITLDRTVVPGAPGGVKTVVNMAEGAFRFVSGRATRDTTEIRTPIASIGIRGTEFDVSSTATLTTVTLIAGEIELCPLAGPRTCVTLRRAGESATAAPGGPARISTTRFSFASFCTSDPALCGRTALATPDRPPPASGRAVVATTARPPRIRLAGPPTVAAPIARPEPALCGR